MREHLELYGRIKGLTGQRLEKLVNRKLDQLYLKDFENKTAGSLSGGNKRKCLYSDDWRSIDRVFGRAFDRHGSDGSSNDVER